MAFAWSEDISKHAFCDDVDVEEIRTNIDYVKNNLANIAVETGDNGAHDDTVDVDDDGTYDSGVDVGYDSDYESGVNYGEDGAVNDPYYSGVDGLDHTSACGTDYSSDLNGHDADYNTEYYVEVI